MSNNIVKDVGKSISRELRDLIIKLLIAIIPIITFVFVFILFLTQKAD